MSLRDNARELGGKPLEDGRAFDERVLSARQSIPAEPSAANTPGVNALAGLNAQSGAADRVVHTAPGTGDGSEPEDYIPVWLSDEVREAVARRSTLGEPVPAVERALARYYYLLDKRMKDLIGNADFSDAELSLICDAVTNSHVLDADQTHMVWAAVENGIRLDGLDTKWAVDSEALVAKLRRADQVTLLALCDYCETFWAGDSWDRSLAEYRAYSAAESAV